MPVRRKYGLHEYSRVRIINVRGHAIVFSWCSHLQRTCNVDMWNRRYNVIRKLRLAPRMQQALCACLCVHCSVFNVSVA